MTSSLVAGVDEFASETQLSAGWTYCVFSPAAIARIDATVAQCKTKAFHGKDFSQRESADYEKLLSAVRTELESDPKALLTFTLQDASWKRSFLPFIEGVVEKSFSEAGIVDSSVIDAAKQLFPGLATLQRLTNEYAGDTIAIHIDSDDVTRALPPTTQLAQGLTAKASTILWAAYEGHREKLFPLSPALIPLGLHVFDDADSRAVQIADVFGNFSLAHIFVELGARSARRVAKSTILRDTFGDLMLHPTLAKEVRIAGKSGNDLQLAAPGGFTLRMGL